MVSSRWLNNKLEYLVQYPALISVLTITIWSILLANCTVFVNWLFELLIQNLFLFLETLAGYSGCCMCWISHKWMIDSPTLWQLKFDWSVGVPACAGGYPRSDWQLNNTVVSTTFWSSHKLYLFAHVKNNRIQNPVIRFVTDWKAEPIKVCP